MLDARPGAAIAHAAFALTAADADAAEALARRAASVGPRAASPDIARWLETGRPAVADHRTPLDPRVDAAMTRLRMLALHPEGDAFAQRAEVLSAWSAAPREVWREAERALVSRVYRAERLVALDAPDLIVRVELEGVARALEGLDGEPRRMGSAPEMDPGPFVELRYAIERHAVLDLSLGAHGETLRALSLDDDPEGSLAAGAPLILEGALAVDDPFEQSIIERLHRWKRVSASVIAARSEALVAELEAVSPSARAAINLRLDADEAEPLRGGDYVAAARDRLSQIAALSTRAAREGLVVLATLAHDDG